MTPRSLITTAAAAVAIGIAAVAAPAASAADTVVSTEPDTFDVSAAAGSIAWSHKDATGWHLTLRAADGAVTTPAAVAPQAAPFDVDLGTNADGSLAAVYSRDGVLHRYDVATGVDSTLDPHVPGALTQPTIWAGRIAFVGTRSKRDRLYVQDAAAQRARHVVTATKRQFILDPELSARRLAYVATGVGRVGFGSETLRIRTISRIDRATSIYTATSGGANEASIVTPSFDADGGTLYWGRTNNGSGVGNRLLRLDFPTGKRAQAIGSSRIQSAAFTDDGGFVLARTQPGQDSTTDLVLTGPLTFTPQR